MLSTHVRRVPAWRRALAAADQAMPVLLALWRRLLRRMRSRVQHRRLAVALGVHPLEAESAVAQVIETELEQPARREVLTAGLALAMAAAQAVLPDIERQTGTAVGLPFALPETRYALEAYVGQQVSAISQTTRQTVRQTVRTGRQAGRSVEAITREVRATIGLTPGQAGAREVMRARLEAEGKTAEDIHAALAQATDQALQRRALLIARTESVDFAQQGLYEAWQQAVRTGAVQEEQVRRYWIVQEDPRVCPGCAEIPDLNPTGVGLHEAFETPWGPKLRPTAHPACRCEIDYRVTGARP